MSRWLKASAEIKYVVKRKRWSVIIDIILESLIVGWLIYYLLFL